jgi:hypothetical protein
MRDTSIYQGKQPSKGSHMHIVRNRVNQDQPEAANFCAVEEVPPAVSPWIFWPIVVSCSLVLTIAAYLLGMEIVS